jgi:hypothetical protein
VVRVVFVILVVLASLLSARPATAGLCFSFAHCSIPSVIHLVGSSGGVPDAAMGEFTVVVRDLVDRPQVHVSVVVQLACDDIQICPNQLDPTMNVNCAQKTVSKYTDETGTARFTIMGSSRAQGGASCWNAVGRIFANGVAIANGGCGADPGVRIAAFDLDGSGGLGPSDVSVWLSDFASNTDSAWTRSDYNGDGRLGPSDLSIWLKAFAAGASAESCAANCP